MFRNAQECNLSYDNQTPKANKLVTKATVAVMTEIHIESNVIVASGIVSIIGILRNGSNFDSKCVLLTVPHTTLFATIVNPSNPSLFDSITMLIDPGSSTVLIRDDIISCTSNLEGGNYQHISH